MQPIRVFNVSAVLPQRLEPLRQLAYNLYWSWNSEATALFRRLDPDLWERSRHNPILMLGNISQTRLQAAAQDGGFLAQMERVMEQLTDYLEASTWYQQQRGTETPDCYAYFSLEFGISDCLPIYSGGLGILAGDHLKSASDLGLPLVGVGLLYQKGYFSQYLNADGWQQERYPINDFYNMPLHLELRPEGSELRIQIDFPDRQVQARIWRIQVGRVPLYLLDTNLPENIAYDQNITDYLYGGDLDLRIHQEILLGIGGVHLLAALGIKPTVYHMNEGHSAFLSLERIRRMIQEQGLSYTEAKQVAQSSQVFTTHTPVPAGIDLFPPDKLIYYLGHYAEVFGLSREELLALGRENTGDFQAPFSMAILAIKMATFVNGVSQLHGQVSRTMFKGLWPNLPVSEVPITSITNGVHARSRTAEVMQDVFDRYLGPEWSDAPATDPLWLKIASIPDEELWRNHERCRYQLIIFARQRLQQSLQGQGASSTEIALAAEVLDPSALTIGFARRFATYKRATLFLQNLNRFRQILLGETQLKLPLRNRKPTVQFVIAGKAHPNDNPGKELIRDIIHFTQQEGMQEQIVFLPDYDLHVTRMMVAGCDIWLNTPLRPLEASGTSGMKAAMNGLPNLSILDGWWDEADYSRTGWAIGHGENYDDLNYQNQVEANALYDCLERDVIPLFYQRDENDIPRSWVAKMKAAIQLNCPQFNTARMVRDYAQRGYFPASDRLQQMTCNNFAPAKELARWKGHLFDHWYNINVEAVEVSAPEQIQVNQNIEVKARLRLSPLLPTDIQVILYQGVLDETGQLVDSTAVAMEYEGEDDRGNSLYLANISYVHSGLQGLALRVLPHHVHLSSPYEMDLVLWA
jgi:glycogen phosphorylase